MYKLKKKNMRKKITESECEREGQKQGDRLRGDRERDRDGHTDSTSKRDKPICSGFSCILKTFGFGIRIRPRQ